MQKEKARTGSDLGENWPLASDGAIQTAEETGPGPGLVSCELPADVCSGVAQELFGLFGVRRVNDDGIMTSAEQVVVDSGLLEVGAQLMTRVLFVHWATPPWGDVWRIDATSKKQA